MVGKIRGLNCDRGFAFVAPNDGGPDVFLHVSDLIDVDFLEPEMRNREVDFEVQETERGRRAVRARLMTEW